MYATESRRRLDFIVGLFVAGAALCAVFIALRAAGIADVSGGGYVVRAQFDQIGALPARAPVKSAGVRVGRVREVQFNDENFIAEVTMVIENEYLFPADSTFSIVSSNLLGGQYISINPGGAEENLQPGQIVVGNDAIVLEHLIGKFLFDKAGE
ncbi:MAG: outer membrane lipid asymmetry maintenance protein MlaD [Gammaproteobacteria bacterium]